MWLTALFTQFGVGAPPPPSCEVPPPLCAERMRSGRRGAVPSGQCRLTVCSSCSQALAIAASLESVSMIGEPSAPSRANSCKPGPDRGRLRKQPLDVLGTDRLHIGDRAVAEMGEFVRRQAADSCPFALVIFHTFPAALQDPPSTRTQRQSRAEILIFFTMRSGCGRTRSMESKPWARSAPRTCMPSASRKLRWNCRAAMPRCRYSRVLSSCWRPRMASWLSSMRDLDLVLGESRPPRG